MESVLDRFLRYVRYDTQSDERSTAYPSTAKQLVLLNDLASELQRLGVADAAVDEHGYLMATVPATTNKPGSPTMRARCSGCATTRRSRIRSATTS
jgi:tripeptide aminopeptidase